MCVCGDETFSFSRDRQWFGEEKGKKLLGEDRLKSRKISGDSGKSSSSVSGESVASQGKSSTSQENQQRCGKIDSDPGRRLGRRRGKIDGGLGKSTATWGKSTRRKSTATPENRRRPGKIDSDSGGKNCSARALAPWNNFLARARMSRTCRLGRALPGTVGFICVMEKIAGLGARFLGKICLAISDARPLWKDLPRQLICAARGPLEKFALPARMVGARVSLHCWAARWKNFRGLGAHLLQLVADVNRPCLRTDAGARMTPNDQYHGPMR